MAAAVEDHARRGVDGGDAVVAGGWDAGGRGARAEARAARIGGRFLSTLFARMRDRFGAEGARVVAAAAPLLSGDALLGFVRAMEGTGSRDWLLAIVRGVTGIAPAIPARIILTNGFLSR